MSALLQVQDLRVVDTRGQVLVRDVGFALHAGEVLTLVGESGSGKSLLAQAVMGALPAGLQAQGRVRLQGLGDDEPHHQAWGRQLAWLPQEPWASLSPLMVAEQQVAEVRRQVSGDTSHAALWHSRQALLALGLADAGQRLPHQLSGGMAQRLAFCASTAAGAAVLIADEPTKGLDAVLRDQVVALLQRHVAGGGALLVITHDLAVARALGGQVAVMQAADWLEHGPAEQVLTQPRHAYTRALLAAQPAAWPRRPGAPAAGAPVLQARGLCKRYGAHTLFDSLDLQLHAGERVALTGPSGSGKTTLGQLLLGLARPDAGQVQRAAGLPATALQKLYQDPLAAFAPQVPLQASFDDVLRRHRLDATRLPSLLGRLGLSPALLARRPAAVSGGELQRLALARVLLLQPAVLLADEPTSRLDPLVQRQTWDVLHQALVDTGCALLLVTHDDTLAAALTARQVVLGTAQPVPAGPLSRPG